MTELWSRVASDEALVLVANGLLQITVLTAGALVVARLFQRNATVRHCILLCAMLSVSAVPVLTVVFHRAGLSVVAIPVAWNSTDRAPPGAPKTDELPVATLPYHEEAGEATHDARIDEPVPPSSWNEAIDATVPGLTHRGPLRSAAGFVVLAWLLGSLVALAGVARSGAKLRRLVRRAKPLSLEKHGRVVEEVCRILGVESLPPVVHSSSIAAPIVVGAFRPLIILPTRLIGVLGTGELRHILLHESAHALRRDQLVGLFQRMLGAVFWPHPLVYLLNRELACAREDVCDNYVLAAVEPAEYGETLLRLGQLMPPPGLATGSVGMFNTRWKLEDRIADLLDKRRDGMIRPRPAFTAAIVVSTLVVSLALAGSRIASAEIPPGGPTALEGPQVQLDPTSRRVDRTLAFLRSLPQRSEETAGEPLDPEKPRVDEVAKNEASEDVSKAVDDTVRALRKRRAQEAAETERLGLYAIDVTDGEVVLVRDKPLGDLTYFGSPSWSTDGRRILFDASPGKSFGKTRLKMIYVEKRCAGIKDLGPGNCPTLSPDGERIAFLLNPGAVPGAPSGIWLMRADGSGRRHLGGYGVPKWSPDGKHLLIGSFSSPCRLSIMDVETEEQRPVRLEGHSFYSNPGWAGDGQTLAALVSSGGEAGIALVDVTDPEQARVKQILWRKGDRIDMSPMYPVYSPRTDLCVFVGRDENGEALYTVKSGQLDVPKRLEPTGYDGKIARLAFSPDGRYVLFCSDRVTRGEPVAEATSTASGYWSPVEQKVLD